MTTILFVGTHGTVDPTRATLPFVLSIGAVQEGHTAQIALLAESPLLVKDNIIAQIKGVGFPPLQDLWQKIIEHQVPVYV